MKNNINLNRFNNKWYKIGASTFKRALWYFISVMFIHNKLCVWNSFKIQLLRIFGAKIGHGVIIKPNVFIKFPWKLSIADNVWIGDNVWIDNLATVTIENNVCISMDVTLLCGNHDYNSSTFDLVVHPITIQQGTWIGAHSTICPGTILHEGSMICVGSTVSSNTDPWSIYRGNPAKKIKPRIISK